MASSNLQLRARIRRHALNIGGTAITSIAILAFCLALAVALSSCGKQAFQVVAAQNAQSAPGTFTVPPKVDILLAEDDTGSIAESLGAIADQFPAFLSSLESKGWDYHFVAIPLTTDRAITHAFASKQDSNWGTLWQPAYPGQKQWLDSTGQKVLPPGNISASVFSIFDGIAATGFIQNNEIKYGLNGIEPAFETILRAFQNRVGGTGFLRSDALTVALVLSNGDDTSKVNVGCHNAGGNVRCEYNGVCMDPSGNPVTQYNFEQYLGQNCGTRAASFEYYKTRFKAVRTTGLPMKFFSMVANQKGSCLNGSSFYGERYLDMANALDGATFDVCTQSLGSMLDSLGQNLSAVRLGYRTRYLFIEQVPDESTLVVTKLPAGGAPITLTRDKSHVNGWDYVGPVNDVFTIDYPVEMNKASGIAIQLFGTARLYGDDTATVSYKPAGASDSRTP